MYKQFQDERYLYWSIIGAVLQVQLNCTYILFRVSSQFQAEDVTTPSTMSPILYKLAHRLLTSSPTPSYVNADRFYLHLSVLYKLEIFDEADKLLDSEVGQSICATNLSVNEIRREIWRKQ